MVLTVLPARSSFTGITEFVCASLTTHSCSGLSRHCRSLLQSLPHVANVVKSYNRVV